MWRCCLAAACATLACMAIHHDLSALGIEDRLYSIEEWQALQKRTGLKFEYYDGRLVDWHAMAGGTYEHFLLSARMISLLNEIAERREETSADAPACDVHTSDLQLKLAQGETYVFSDAAVVCGAPEYDTVVTTAVRNPIVVVEIMSPSSAKYDSSRKFAYYAALPSLRQYVLVDQEDIAVEVRTRDAPDGGWSISFFTEREDAIPLGSLDGELSVSRLYRRMRFDWEDSGERDEPTPR